MSFDLSVITGNMSLFLAGAELTVLITALSTLLGLMIGAVLAWCAFMPSVFFRFASGGLVAILRGFPFIILLFLVNYGLPFAHIRVGAFPIGAIALAIYSAAYYAEVIRGGVISVPKGQYEAARMLGLTGWQSALLVIVPQAARAMIPPATNVTLSLLKDSAILSTITLPELTYQGLVVQGDTFAPFEVFVALAVLYWLISSAITVIARAMERRFSRVNDRGIRHSKLVASYLTLD